MKRTLFTLIAIALLSAGISAQSTDDRLKAVEDGLKSLTTMMTDFMSRMKPPTPPPPVESMPPTELSLKGVPLKGASDAKVVLIEFSDFECPFCGQHAKGTYTDIQKQYVSNGKIQYAFRNFPLERMHPSARQAAEAGACANEQGKFWELHDSLFANQKALQLADIQQYAKSAQTDTAKFDTCMTKHLMAERVSEDLTEARRLGLNATPAFVLGELQPNGTVRVTKRIIGSHPLEVFQQALDEQLGER
jgi:protein-disulfide isomerase